MVSIIFSKLLYLIIIFIICYVGGIAPLTFKSYFGNKSLSYSSCTGAGILLGASFLHLLKDGDTLLEGSEFPYAHLIYTIGFFSSFILERVLFEHSHSHDSSNGSGHSHSEDEIKMNEIKESNNNMVSLFVGDNNSNGNSNNTSSGDGASPILNGNGSGINSSNGGSDDGAEEFVTNEIEFDESGNILKKKTCHGHEHNHKQHKHTTGKSTFPFMLFAVLSLESIVSGLAVGVQDNPIPLFVTFVAIITHIWAESFALSSNIMKSMTSVNNNQADNHYINSIVRKSTFAFSSVTPLGILFGLVSKSILSDYQTQIISGILLSFAGGCFLYVAVFEIMVEEFENSKQHTHHQDHQDQQEQQPQQPKLLFKLPQKWKKLLLLLSGFTFMTLIAIYV